MIELVPATLERRIRVALVTGATGGIGRRLVARLLDEGARVRALVRDPARASDLREGIEIVRGDLGDPAALRGAAEGADTVFHLAAWTGRPFSRQAARAANVDGTRALLEVAAAAGVERVVHVSSVAAYGPVASGEITEEHPFRSVNDLYSDTKAEGDALALTFAHDTGLGVVVVRPSLVYGPGIEPWTLVPVRAIRSGSPIVIGDGLALANPVYVDTVVDGLMLAATRAGVEGEAFNLSDGIATSWNDFFGYYARMLGRPLRRVPRGLAEAGAGAVAAVAGWLGQPPRASREMVGVTTGRALFSVSKARERLGFEPRVGLEEGMRRTEAWLREHGHLKGSVPAPNPAAPPEDRPVVLVSGAASGLGRAAALRLAGGGWRVLAGDLDEAALASLAAPGIETLCLDVTSDESVANAARRLAEIGRVDALLNVAGFAAPGPLERQPMSVVRSQLEVNALGPLRLARAVAPLMRARGAGRIVNVSSTNGRVVSPFMGAYSASKFALEALSDALRLELAPFGIGVVIVQPGSMRTEFAERAQARLADAAFDAAEYRPYLERFARSSMWGNGTSSPEQVAAVLERVLRSPNPAPRVAATPDALPAMLVARLPDRLRDRLFSSLAGLRKPLPALEEGSEA